MMHNLFSGPAVVIDDKIEAGGSDLINQLIEEIEERNIPCVKYEKLPEDEIAEHLSGVSFLILDWHLQDLPEGVQISQSVLNDSIEFLKHVVQNSFVPIFIFTSESVDAVQGKLKKSGLYKDESPNLIFIENKNELVGGNLFQKISDWIEVTPSVYVLKEWEKEYKKSKTDLFINFYNLSHSWPLVLWSAYEDDSVDPSYALGEVITRNLHSRMSPFNFDPSLLSSSSSIDKEELRSVLAGEKFIENKNGALKEQSISSGDIFRYKVGSSTRYSVFINIRPDCDCINRDGSIDDVELYLLEMSQVSTKKEKEEFFQEKFGNFKEQDTNTFLFNVYKDKSFQVIFKKMSVVRYGDIKENRIGRLLPPYSFRVQQRYSLYLQRLGLPRTPKEAVLDVVE